MCLSGWGREICKLFELQGLVEELGWQCLCVLWSESDYGKNLPTSFFFFFFKKLPGRFLRKTVANMLRQPKGPSRGRAVKFRTSFSNTVSLKRFLDFTI